MCAYATVKQFLCYGSYCEPIEHIELPVNLLDYFLRSDKNNINQNLSIVRTSCSLSFSPAFLPLRRTPSCRHVTLSKLGFSVLKTDVSKGYF